VVVPASAVSLPSSAGPIIRLFPERPQSDLPILQPYLAQNIIHLAWAQDIPVYAVRQMSSPAVWEQLQMLQPDIACTACFPWRIPPEVLAVPRLGFLNIHPSRLPAYRGPSPLFWIFRNGDQENSGVTLHWMDETLDTGDILSRRSLTLPDGISGPEADRLCAAMGGEMLLKALDQITIGQIPRQPQTPGGSYHSWPTAEAFTLDQSWPARRAFNFMRGTAEWNHLYTLTVGSETLTLTTAESFDPSRKLAQPFQLVEGLYQIQFSPGTLLAY
jgi:methionyl-tRNA formyltransferase